MELLQNRFIFDYPYLYSFLLKQNHHYAYGIDNAIGCP